MHVCSLIRVYAALCQEVHFSFSHILAQIYTLLVRYQGGVGGGEGGLVVLIVDVQLQWMVMDLNPT